MSRERSGDPPKTAAELMTQLERDPAYQARIAAKESERLARVAEHRRDAGPIVAELVEAGYAVESISIRELLATGVDLHRAITILLAWLPRVTNLDVKESVVRTLSVPFAKPTAARPLIDEYRELDPNATELRWAIGNALEVVADDSVLDEMIALARDRRYGRSREMLVVGLGNMKDQRVIPALIDLLNDEDVTGHAIVALGKLRPPAARAHVEPFLKHPKQWVRKEAKKTIEKIDKAGSRRGRIH